MEDDGSLGRSLARFLQASGYQPVTYHCAEAFLGDAKKPVFDCLIVDIQLAGMSGLELGERLLATAQTFRLFFSRHMKTGRHLNRVSVRRMPRY